MNLLLTTLKKILFWSYDRGTWQYDVLCVLILAFIFLSPNYLFKSGKPLGQNAVQPTASSVENPVRPGDSSAAHVPTKLKRSEPVPGQKH